jgi:U4/U6 small nuclear ribonucleoprotein PRP31
VSKKHKAAMNFQSNNNPNSGLQSSVAFTPIKGIELENPQIAAQRIQKINNKYFGAATFKNKE